jgi:hypothetical protein
MYTFRFSTTIDGCSINLKGRFFSLRHFSFNCDVGSCSCNNIIILVDMYPVLIVFFWEFEVNAPDKIRFLTISQPELYSRLRTIVGWIPSEERFFPKVSEIPARRNKYNS